MKTGTSWVAGALLLFAALMNTGCASACSEAVSLCEQCDSPTVNCDNTFNNASEAFCEEAVETYKVSEEEGGCTN